MQTKNVQNATPQSLPKKYREQPWRLRVPNPERESWEDVRRLEPERYQLELARPKRSGCRHDMRKLTELLYMSSSDDPYVPLMIATYIAREDLVESEWDEGHWWVCLKCWRSAGVQKVLHRLWPVEWRLPEPERIKPVNEWWKYEAEADEAGTELPDCLHTALINMQYRRSKTTKRGPLLDGDQMLALWQRCGGRCELTGITLDVGDASGRRPRKPSIDRIDASRGYEFENCRVVAYQVNLALSDFGDEAFAAMCHAYVAKHPTPPC